MEKATVYFTKDISPDELAKAYKALGVELPGKVAVKISTGEPGGHNFLQPALIKDLVAALDGTIVECNTAYPGRRDTTEEHLKAFEEHGFTAIAPCDLMDIDGEIALPVEGGVAEKAGKATAVAMDKAHTAVDKVKPVVSEAAEKTGEVINKGAYATGKQISKTKTMFSDFKSEYDKARGPKPKDESRALPDAPEGEDLPAATTKPDGSKSAGKTGTAKSGAAKPVAKKTSASGAAKKKEAPESESIGKAVGSHMKKAGGMFSAFKEEYDKARRDDK